MTVASIFHFEFWFLWGVVFGAFLGAFWRPVWILRASLGALCGSFGAPLDVFFASLDVLLVAVGCIGVLWASQGAPGTYLGGSGVISGIFREILGGLLVPFWTHCWSFFRVFLDFVF